MNAARTFRDLRVYQLARAASLEVFAKAMISESWGRRRYKAVFISKIDEALGEATKTQSWLEDALDCGYLEASHFEKMDSDWHSLAAMLARMIDRASDFCKDAPNTDYRVKEDLSIWNDLSVGDSDAHGA